MPFLEAEGLERESWPFERLSFALMSGLSDAPRLREEAPVPVGDVACEEVDDEPGMLLLLLLL